MADHFEEVIDFIFPFKLTTPPNTLVSRLRKPVEEGGHWGYRGNAIDEYINNMIWLFIVNYFTNTMQMNRFDSLADENSYKLELFFCCRNLKDLDFITVTDSFLIVKLQEQNKQ